MLFRWCIGEPRVMRCRGLLLLMSASLAACAYVVHPVQSTVTVGPDMEKSGHVKGEVHLWLTVRNESDETLRFSILDGIGPPYELGTFHYRVLKDSSEGFVKDSEHTAFDGVPGLATLRVESTDSVVMGAFMENVTPADCSRWFKIELEDLKLGILQSKAFNPCPAAGDLKFLEGGSGNSGEAGLNQ